ncbi:unnamed protein product, partial [marine sediment metagenome]
ACLVLTGDPDVYAPAVLYHSFNNCFVVGFTE